MTFVMTPASSHEAIQENSDDKITKLVCILLQIINRSANYEQ